MKKSILLRMSMLSLFCVIASISWAQTEATATWVFDQGTDGQVATYSPDDVSKYFKTSYVTLGRGLDYFGTVDYNYVNPKEVDENTITYTIVQPSTEISSASGNDKDVNAIDFIIVPKAGMTFTPTSVSFNALRVGTGGGDISIFWVSDTGKETELEQGIVPGRNKDGESNPNYEFSYNVSASGSTGACGLRIYVYNLATDKQDGFANVVINGTLTGELEDVTQYNLTVNISPEGAATVKKVPDETTFDEGDQVTLTQIRGFGYQFDGWTDESGATLSTDDTYTVTMDGDKVITANYTAIDTYELTINMDSEANDYMVECDPEPTLIDGKKMYEAGTVVALTASSNKILTFTNWSTGSTESTIALTMNQDQTIGASYSAIDYIAGWDFYLTGNENRPADFAATNNETDELILRDADGNTVSWLDKSEEADGGYNGKAAAVNWKTNGQGYYYWQTMVNAAAYTDIKVSSAMQYNFLAYTKYDVQYSLNNADWTTVGTFSLTEAKNWVTQEFSLPSDANNQEELYIRWYPDKSSSMDGTDSDNDGIAIAEIFITGTEEVVDDGTAPVLESSVPEDGATEVSASGKIVLTFDEKVQVVSDAVATIGTQEITPTVSGKTITFAYSGLEYSTEYTFTLPANSVCDLSGNALADAIIITFSTKTKPEVEKKLFDFIVPDDGDLEAALAAANSRSNTSERYRIFIKKGTYTVPEKSATIEGGDGNYYPCSTDTINKPNVSIIGEDRDATIICNTVPSKTYSGSNGTVNVIEGLGKCETLDIESKATNTYFQDITLKNSLPDNTGRGAALEDKSDKTICMNVCLYGYQDTYYSRSSNRYYFEGGKLRGRTDFLCGRGDIFFNGVELVMCASGGYLTAPSVPKEYGYIFRDCTINGESSSVNGNYYLGRPWGTGTPVCLYINTTMNAEPSSVGWHDMSDDNYPARFAEYNSMTSSGSTISLSSRKTTYGSGNHTNDPVLTAQEAALYTIETVMGSTDGWDPTEYTEQASAPQNVVIDGTSLTWDNSNYVLCWAICKNGSVVDFTTSNNYTIEDASATYSVRAANEMGGLGDATVAITSGIKEIENTVNGDIIRTSYYNLQGARINNSYKGIVIKVDTMEDGNQIATKIIK